MNEQRWKKDRNAVGMLAASAYRAGMSLGGDHAGVGHGGLWRGAIDRQPHTNRSGYSVANSYADPFADRHAHA